MNDTPALPQTPSAPDTIQPVLRLVPQGGLSYFWRALNDIAQGFHYRMLALTLAWLDIRLRYRGSILGPFWLTGTTTIMVAAMGVLYSYLLEVNVHQYLPFLTFSIVLWSLVAGVLREGCTAFTSATRLIHSARMPYTLHVIRVLVRNILVFAHSVPVVLGVFLWFHVRPHHLAALLPATALWLVDCFFAIMLLGVLGARFRDTSPIVASLTQIAFFVTPVIWAPQLMATGQNWLLLDPFFPLIEILRAPFTGDIVQVAVWPAALGWSALLGLVTFCLFARMRTRLAYWV
ncbi:ABC transporter permease [Acetobacter sp. TBRC 12305]|uniref:ABC transporter permease n=1 Tax=Acetobacter garciniae TaxID=2817435 RepID=A0A939HIW1_9PROT|nr:ABC transporter permease [Acetobacter garciniae]MBO1323550.1 ABC transporter permease [Acetobacter garciniae]MBX0343239.1 ABC transporter permease [Acetobacter garciniae]